MSKIPTAARHGETMESRQGGRQRRVAGERRLRGEEALSIEFSRIRAGSVTAKLKEPETKKRKFEDVVKSAEQAAVFMLVY
jgi:hypothetical protein